MFKSIKSYKKHFRGRFKSTTKGISVRFGDLGLAALQSNRISEATLNAVKNFFKKAMKDKGKLYVRISPDFSITKKPLKMKMGAGCGKFESLYSYVKSGKVLFEISGIERLETLKLFRIAQDKLPFKCVILENRI